MILQHMILEPRTPIPPLPLQVLEEARRVREEDAAARQALQQRFQSAITVRTTLD